VAVIAALAMGVLVTSGCSKDDASSTPPTLVIGDSLTVGAEIGGLGRGDGITVDAEQGRTTAEGTAIATDTDLGGYGRVIVALGTNDSTDTAEEFEPKVDAMMAVLGDEVPVAWVNVDTGTDKLAPAAEGVNAALAAAAKRYDNLTIADWDGYINGRDDADDLRVGDGVHDSSEGYRVRAGWMQQLAAG
jgi:hypothetical protein